MSELLIGLACFILGMLVMYIYDQREYTKLSELSEKTFQSTFNSILEILKLVNKDKDDLRWKNLTWKCEVCRRERPDDKISVYKHPCAKLEGAITHIKYCNDTTNCEEMARNYGLFELKSMAKENEDGR